MAKKNNIRHVYEMAILLQQHRNEMGYINRLCRYEICRRALCYRQSRPGVPKGTYQGMSSKRMSAEAAKLEAYLQSSATRFAIARSSRNPARAEADNKKTARKLSIAYNSENKKRRRISMASKHRRGSAIWRI